MDIAGYRWIHGGGNHSPLHSFPCLLRLSDFTPFFLSLSPFLLFSSCPPPAASPPDLWFLVNQNKVYKVAIESSLLPFFKITPGLFLKSLLCCSQKNFCNRNFSSSSDKLFQSVTLKNVEVLFFSDMEFKFPFLQLDSCAHVTRYGAERHSYITIVCILSANCLHIYSHSFLQPRLPHHFSFVKILFSELLTTLIILLGIITQLSMSFT